MANSESEKRRTRSPAYPSVGLEESLRLARILWEKEDHHPFAVETAAANWEYKETSSAVGQLVSALKQFGLLIEDESSSGFRQLRLSPLALDILVADGDDQNTARRAAIKTAALTPKIHKEIWEKYGGKLPSDSTLRVFLLRERETPFNKDYVDKFIEQFRGTVAFAKLSESDTITPADGGKDEVGDKKTPTPPVSDSGKGRRNMDTAIKEAVCPLDVGEVVLKWPANISAEEIEDVETWMELMVKKIKRTAQARNEDPSEN
jgi:hypothetical protein